MRTFPKELAEFRRVVEEKGAELRQRPFAELKQLGNRPLEDVTVAGRKGTIGTIVLSLPDGGVKIVLQGFLEHRWAPGKSVALDGFNKYPDETTEEMEAEEFYNFD